MKTKLRTDSALASAELNVSLEPTQSIWKLFILALGFLMATLDVTIINVAIPEVRQSLSINLSQATWVVDGYILTFAAFLLISGSLANRYGAKNIYVSGLTVFVLASVLCAQASSGNMLIISRLIQGVGAALFMPSSLSLLAHSYTDEKQRAKMFGIWAAIVSIASGIGPFIGGTLVNFAGWRSIFYINLPIGIVALIFTYKFISNTSIVKQKLNVLDHLLGIISLSALSYVLIQGPHIGWSSNYILGTVVLGGISFILFVWRERKISNPIMPRELFKNSKFSSSNFVGFLLNFSLFGGIFMFSLFLQEAKDSTAFMAGLQLVPMMAVFIIGNLCFSKLSNKYRPVHLMFFSLVMSAMGSLVLVILLSPSTPYWLIALVFSITNLGVGITVPAMTTTVMAVAGKENSNIAGATLNANRQIGALVGVAIMGLIISLSNDWYLSAANSFGAMAILYSLAAVLTWFFILRPEKNIR